MDAIKQMQLQADFVADFTKSDIPKGFVFSRKTPDVFIPDFTDTPAPVQRNRPLKADSSAYIIAEYLLRDIHLTIQDAVYRLKLEGKVSNDPGRRMRESRSWIERQGLKVGVSDYYKKDKAVCKIWFVHPNPELQQAALAKLKKVK